MGYPCLHDEIGAANYSADEDIDLPLLLRKSMPKSLPDHISLKTLSKRDFINTYLIFDFEPHDLHFDPKIISHLQRVFNSPEDNGKLYLNYPMVQSYIHFDYRKKLDYLSLTESLSILPNGTRDLRGKKYKEKAHKEGSVEQRISVIQNLENRCLRFGLSSKFIENACQIPYDSHLGKNSKNSSLVEELKNENLILNENIVYQIQGILFNSVQLSDGETLFCFHRKTVGELISWNILKSMVIINAQFSLDMGTQDVYKSADSDNILAKQLDCLEKENKIFVLNTSLFLVPEFNSNLITNELYKGMQEILEHRCLNK